MTRVAGALTKSGEVMKLVNSLMRVPQLSRTMAEMSRGEGGGGRVCARPAWTPPRHSVCAMAGSQQGGRGKVGV